MSRNSFNWSGDVYIDVDIEYDDALMSIPLEYILDYVDKQLHEKNEPSYTDDLADPVKRLEVITAMRLLGYVVEPA